MATVRNTRALPLLSTLGLGLLLASSAGCVEPEEGTTEDQFRVINGDPASSNVAEYAATVGLHQRSGDQVGVSPFCSGTLIASDVILTAAHCCDEAFNGPNVNPMEPEEVAIYFGDGPAFSGNSLNGEFYAVSEVSVHPSYNRYSLENDICLMRLSVANQDTAPVPPLPAWAGLTEADSGEMLDHVGFGYSDLAKTEYGVKLHAEVPMAGLGCAVAGCPSPGTVGQFSYVQDGDPYFGPCNGDSGGPAFISRNGTTYVAGVTSYGDANCEIYGVSTNVSAYQDYIDGFVGTATPDCSADGVCNLDCADGEDVDCGGGDGGGDGGAGSCGDGLCEAGESCDGRNGTTSCPSDCAGVTKGKPAGRYCWVGDTCEGPGC